MQRLLSLTVRMVILILFSCLLFSCRDEKREDRIANLQVSAQKLSRKLESTTIEIRNLLNLLEVERPAKEHKEYVRLINVKVPHGKKPKSGFGIKSIEDKPGWTYVKAEIQIERNDYELGSIWITSSTTNNFEYKRLSEFIDRKNNVNRTYLNITNYTEILDREIIDSYTDFASVSERFENFVTSRKIGVNSSHPTIEYEWNLSHGDWIFGRNNDEHGNMIAGLEITYRKNYELEYVKNIEKLYSEISEIHRKLWFLNKEIEEISKEKERKFF